MKILILNWRDIKNPLAGGAEQSLHEHAKYWKKKGAEITWISSSFAKAKSTENIDGINIVRFGSHYTIHSIFILKSLLGKHKDYDLIIDSFHFLPYFSPLLYRKKKVIALINEVADKLWFSNLPLPFSWIGYKVEPLLFKLYKNIPFITASNSAKKDLKKMGIKSSNIKVIPHGVTLPRLLPKKNESKNPTIIYCSRITKDKGIEDAIRAFSILKKEIPNLVFWIVGKEEKRGYLDEVLSNNRILKDQVEYFGFVTEKKKFELLSKAWVMIHPSKKEGWGLNVIEADSVGTPTVGYDVEGLRDSIKDKETGLLSKVNPNDLAEKLKQIIENSKMRKELSHNSIRWSKEFSWEKSGKKSWSLITSRLS